MNKKITETIRKGNPRSRRTGIYIRLTNPTAKLYPLSQTREIVERYCVSAGFDPLSYLSNFKVKLLVGSAQEMTV